MKTENKLAAVAAELQSDREQAAQLYKTFEAAKAKATEDRGDGKPRAWDQESAEYVALNEANRDYSAKVDEINAKQAQLNALGELLDSKPAEGAGAEVLRRFSEGSAISQSRSVIDEQGVSAFGDWRAQMSGVLRDPGSQFGNSPKFKVLDKADVGRGFFSRLSGVSDTTVAIPAYPSVPWRRPGIVPALLENLDVLDIIDLIPTDAEVIQIVTEAAFTNIAVETAEQSAAPEAAESFTLSTVSCQWIPATIPMTRQILADEPRLQAFIQNRLLWSIRDRLQNQFINGNGAGQNLTGIVNWPNVLNQLKVVVGSPLEPQLDAVLAAKTAIIVATKGMYMPQYLLMNPSDFEEIQLAKDTLGRYIYGGPQSGAVGTVWGMTPVVHPLFAQGCPIIADMRAFEGYIREDVSLSVTDSHSDHFTKGIVDFLASGRFACAVTQPKAFCTINNWNA